MKHQKIWIGFFLLALIMIKPSVAGASVILNEIFADPPAGLAGDANNDGVRSGTQDEFIELLNNNAVNVDISGWSLSDSVSLRHIFPANTVLAPNAFLTVFGGGSPVLPGINWQVASSGSLGLNNGGDSVSLLNVDDLLIDQVTYGSMGNNDQSITLFPDGMTTEFVLHSTLEQAQGALFSPGTKIDGELFDELSLVEAEEVEPLDNPVVPELPTLMYFGLGWGSLFIKRYIL